MQEGGRLLYVILIGRVDTAVNSYAALYVIALQMPVTSSPVDTQMHNGGHVYVCAYVWCTYKRIVAEWNERVVRKCVNPYGD